MKQRKKMRCLAILFLFLISFFAMGAADTHYVWRDNPAPQTPFTNNWASAATNIQDAVDVATTNDTVLVTNGTYSTESPRTYGGAADYSVVCVSNSITLRSVNGPSVTVIDATNTTKNVRVLTFSGAIDGLSAKTTTVSGFTIRNGKTTSGFVNNSGGGIFYHNTNYLSYSTYNVVTNCIFYNNSAYGSGGAIYFHYGAGGYIYNCSIYSNSASAAGGIGFSWSGASIYNKIYNCSFWRNVAAYAWGDGGAVSVGASHLEMKNCLLYENTTGWRGGALWFTGSSTPWTFLCNLENCTFAGNRATNGIGGGFAITSRVPFIARNVIIYNNYALDSSYPNIYLADSNSHSPSSYTNCFTNSCVAPTAIYDLPVTQGNITNNPSFRDTNNANYRLSENSPCINTGTNQSWMTNAVDLDGNQRIRYGFVDIGAYEYIRPAGTVFTVY